MKKKVRDLKENDLVDLEGDPYHSDPEDAAIVECEYARVTEVVRETDECYCVHFENVSSAAYQPDTEFEVVEPEAPDEWDTLAGKLENAGLRVFRFDLEEYQPKQGTPTFDALADQFQKQAMEHAGGTNPFGILPNGLIDFPKHEKLEED
jgi:hypothetical protein